MCKSKLKMCNVLKHICTQNNCAKKWTILCAKLINTLCNKNINNTVQNVVQCCAIHEQNLCAIFFNFIDVQKNCAIFCENKCNTGNVGNTKIYCIVLYILLNFVNNIGTSWFADAAVIPQPQGRLRPLRRWAQR